MSEERKDVIEVIEPEIVSSTSMKPVDIMGNIENISVDRAVKILEKKSAITQALRNIAIKNTSDKKGWVNLGGKMYASDSVISVIVRDCGINHETLEIEKKKSEDQRGTYYIYVATVRAYHPWIGEIVKTGVATQRDKFFAFANGEWKDDIDIPEASIMKKAETNAIGRCVREMLGLSDMTEAEIGKEAGANVSYVKNKKNSNTADTKEDKEKKEPPKKDKLENMHNQVMAACSDNETLYETVVHLISGGFGNLKSIMDISTEKWRQRFVVDFGKKELSEWISEAESMLEKETNNDGLPF